MNKQAIQRHKQAFDQAICNLDESDVEYYTTRELITLLGYHRWKNFSNALNKAKTVYINNKIEQYNHFRDTTKMVTIESGTKRPVAEVMLKCR